MSIFPLLFWRSFSSTFTHSTPHPSPASMHSLKLCLIASHHSHPHSAPSACLHAHMHTNTHTKETPAHSHVGYYLMESVIFYCTTCISIWVFVFIFSVHLLILCTYFGMVWFILVTIPLTLKQGYVCLFFRLHIVWMYKYTDTRIELPNPSGISRTGHFYFLCLRSDFWRRMVYCRGPFIMYRTVLY